MSTVAIIIANRNHANYLPDSIGSVLAQSTKPDELIIIDDESTDNSWNVIETLTKNVPYCKIFKKSHSGANDTINYGISKTKCDYFISLGADDKLHPDCVAIVKEATKDAPIGVVGGLSKFTDVTLDCQYVYGFGPNRRKYLTPNEFCDLSLQRKISIFTNAMAIRTKCAIEFGSHFLPAEHHADWLLYYSIIYRHGIYWSNRMMSEFFKRPYGYSAQRMLNYDIQRKTLQNILDYLLLPQHSDVAKQMKDGAALANFGWQMIDLVLLKKYRYFLTKNFLTNALIRGIMTQVKSIMPNKMQKFILELKGNIG